MASKVKYFGITLTGKMKDLYNKNFKTEKKTPEDGKIHADGSML